MAKAEVAAEAEAAAKATKLTEAEVGATMGYPADAFQVLPRALTPTLSLTLTVTLTLTLTPALTLT